MKKPPTREQLTKYGIDPLVERHGYDHTLAVLNALIQHRLGRPADAWDWVSNQATEQDIEAARKLLQFIQACPHPDPAPRPLSADEVEWEIPR